MNVKLLNEHEGLHPTNYRWPQYLVTLRWEGSLRRNDEKGI
jgi:hypothetical protein